MLRVSGLPVDITKSELDKLFSPYGKITLLTEIKRDKSAAIAEVKLDGDVYAAANQLNGKPFRGQCHLTVEAHPKVDGPDGPDSYNLNTVFQSSNSTNTSSTNTNKSKEGGKSSR